MAIARQPEEFAKEYTALQRDLDSAITQLKEAGQRRAGYDEAIRTAARAVGTRAVALRAQGATGRALDDFKSDAEVSRILAGLDERLVPAEAERQRVAALAAGAWKKTLERYTALDRALTLEIAARRKPAAPSPGSQAVSELVRLQTDLRKTLDPRRAALQAGESALEYHRDPGYFRKKRAEWMAVELATAAPVAASPVGAAKAAGDAPQATPKPAPSAAPPGQLLTAAAFKASGNQARRLFADLRRDVAAAKAAQKKKDRAAVTAAQAGARRHLGELDALVRPYEAAREQTGEAVIVKLPNGKQLLAGIKALVALRAKARLLAQSISKPG